MVEVVCSRRWIWSQVCLFFLALFLPKDIIPRRCCQRNATLSYLEVNSYLIRKSRYAGILWNLRLIFRRGTGWSDGAEAYFSRYYSVSGDNALYHGIKSWKAEPINKISVKGKIPLMIQSGRWYDAEMTDNGQNDTRLSLWSNRWIVQIHPEWHSIPGMLQSIKNNTYPYPYP